MAGTRHEQLGKLQTALERNYASSPLPERPLLEHLLYAACLEDSTFEAADESLAKLQEFFIDWNEVRVSTITELSQVLSKLTDPVGAARRLKTTLQSVFEHGVLEQNYSFDLEFLKKEKQSVTVEAVKGLMGVSAFMVAYLVQQGLGGHMIPVDQAAVRLARCLDLLKDAPGADAEPAIPSLDRAIGKSDGPEFFTRLHRAAVECYTAQITAPLKKLFREVHPEGLDLVTKLHEEAQAAAAEANGPRGRAGGSAKPRPAAEPTAPGATGKAAPGAAKPARGKETAAEPTAAPSGGKKRGRPAASEKAPEAEEAASPAADADSKARRRATTSDGPTPRPSRKRLPPPEAEANGNAEPASEPAPATASKGPKTTTRRKPR